MIKINLFKPRLWVTLASVHIGSGLSRSLCTTYVIMGMHKEVPDIWKRFLPVEGVTKRDKA